jgi:hypothetical protein
MATSITSKSKRMVWGPAAGGDAKVLNARASVPEFAPKLKVLIFNTSPLPEKVTPRPSYSFVNGT